MSLVLHLELQLSAEKGCFSRKTALVGLHCVFFFFLIRQYFISHMKMMEPVMHSFRPEIFKICTTKS